MLAAMPLCTLNTGSPLARDPKRVIDIHKLSRPDDLHFKQVTIHHIVDNTVIAYAFLLIWPLASGWVSPER